LLDFVQSFLEKAENSGVHLLVLFFCADGWVKLGKTIFVPGFLQFDRACEEQTLWELFNLAEECVDDFVDALFLHGLLLWGDLAE